MEENSVPLIISEEDATEALEIGCWIASVALDSPEKLAQIMQHITDGIDMQNRLLTREGKIRND